MSDYAVLIISRHPLLVAAVRYAAEKSGVGAVLQVDSMADALDIVESSRPATIVVDIDEGASCETVAATLLSRHGADCQVVCISLDTSDITVFTRERIVHANQSDLAAVLGRSLARTLGALP